jgi:hypothetical protein
MLLNQPLSNFPAPTVSWGEVTRACRRVCVLRERGQIEEAEQLRAGQLMELVAAARTADDSDAAVAERLNAILAAETERVANAAVLAELLAPLLAGQGSRRDMPPPVPPSAPPPSPVPVAPPPAKLPGRRPASIADFIDDMIAQENPPDPSTPARRRAS